MGLGRLEYVWVTEIRHLEVLLGSKCHWRRICRNSTVSIHLKVGLLYIWWKILRYPLHVLLVRDHVWLHLVLGQEHKLVCRSVVTLLAPGIRAETHILWSKLYSRRLIYLTYWYRVLIFGGLILFGRLPLVIVRRHLIAAT